MLTVHCAVTLYFSRSRLSPLAQDCTWRLESGTHTTLVSHLFSPLTLETSQLNVLIDDSGKAVLCDFGLSRIKADVASRTVEGSGGSIVGSRYWMAPERLLGGSLKKPCDIYAFAMTLYEVGTRYGWIEHHESDLTNLKDLHKRNSARSCQPC
jgi:hypothetical protein